MVIFAIFFLKLINFFKLFMDNNFQKDLKNLWRAPSCIRHNKSQTRYTSTYLFKLKEGMSTDSSTTDQ